MFETKLLDSDVENSIGNLIGSSRRNITFNEAALSRSYCNSSDNNVGEGGTTFELVFP